MVKKGSGLWNERVQTFSICLVLILLFGLVYILNNLFPLFGEDWDYSFVWTMDGKNANTLKNVSDIFFSQYNHYMIWGGRSVAHTIDQFLILINSTWRNLINTGAYVLFVFLIYKIVNYANRADVKIFLLVAFALWFLLPNMPSIIIWKTYSAVYLWSTLITVLFIYPYCKYYRTNTTKNTLLMSSLMLLGGIIAGWSYENLSLSLICFLVLFLLIMKYQRIKIPLWMFMGFLGTVVGCAILLLSPGNFKRASSVVSDISLFYTILYRIWDLLREYVYHILFLSIIYLIVLYFFVKKAKTENKQKLKLFSLVFIISAHFGLIVMLASPIFPARTLFGSIAFMILAIGILFANIPMQTVKLNVINWMVIGVITIVFCFDYYGKYNQMVYFHDFWKNREVFVEEQKKMGVKDIVFDDALVVNRKFIETTCDFKSSIDAWPNFSYAKYYDLASVRNK